MKPDVQKIFNKLSEKKTELSIEKVELGATDDLAKILNDLNRFAKSANRENQNIVTNRNEAQELDKKAEKAYLEAEELNKQVKERLDTANELDEVVNKYLRNLNNSIKDAKNTSSSITSEIDDANQKMIAIEQQAKELGIKPTDISIYSKAKNRIPEIEKIKRNLELAIKEGLKPLK